MTSNTDSAARPPGAWITLSYHDAEAALTYLRDVIGFRELVVHRSEERPIAHAEMLWPQGGGIMFGSEPVQRWSGAAGAPGTATAYLCTPDVEAIAERVHAAGWMIIRPVQTTDYGATEFSFTDPEGNAWSVGTYPGEGF